MDYVTRVNLKTASEVSRPELINFCLRNTNKQYLAIGWSYIYNSGSNNEISSYKDYYYKVKEGVKKINRALNVFRDTKKDNLFWTRDLDGYYWICRAMNEAQTILDENISVQKGKALDIGAVIPVEAYKYGIDVPGAIKASFNKPLGGITEKIYDKLIIEFSKFVFNKISGKYIYNLIQDDELISRSKENYINNLPDFDLEELVISYIQIEYDYYLLSNPIANKSTTIKIEGEFYSRNLENPSKAVVQVKGPKYNSVLSASSFKQFIADGYFVFLYANNCETNGLKNVIVITKDELESFYFSYKAILPGSITKWENIFSV